MKRRGHAALISLVMAGFIIGSMVNVVRASITPSATSTSKTDVLVFLQPGNTAIKDRLSLDNRLNLTYEYNGSIAQKNKLNYYDVFFVCGYLPRDPQYIKYLNDNVTSGKGLFIWGGYYEIFAESNPDYLFFMDMLPVEFKMPFTIEEELYLDQDWVGQIELKVNSNYLWSDGMPATSPNLLQRSVVWESSPLVKERIFVNDANSSAKVLVYRPMQNLVGKSFSLGEPLVAYQEVGPGTSKGRVLWVSMVVGSIKAYFSQYITQGVGPYWTRVPIPGTSVLHDLKGNDANKPFYLWPYFNYFLFQSVRFLSGNFTSASEIDTYAQWPYSPIPHETEATLWMIFVAGLWVFNFVLFFSLGKKKKTAGREVVAAGSEAATSGERELTAEERKALETTKSDEKSLVSEEKKSSEDEKK
ncbi:MAG: hypothetical protein Q6373_004600 [Candidatus Sigynarchaeota archaeon]